MKSLYESFWNPISPLCNHQLSVQRYCFDVFLLACAAVHRLYNTEHFESICVCECVRQGEREIERAKERKKVRNRERDYKHMKCEEETVCSACKECVLVCVSPRLQCVWECYWEIFLMLCVSSHLPLQELLKGVERHFQHKHDLTTHLHAHGNTCFKKSLFNTAISFNFETKREMPQEFCSLKLQLKYECDHLSQIPGKPIRVWTHNWSNLTEVKSKKNQTNKSTASIPLRARNRKLSILPSWVRLSHWATLRYPLSHAHRCTQVPHPNGFPSRCHS